MTMGRSVGRGVWMRQREFFRSSMTVSGSPAFHLGIIISEEGGEGRGGVDLNVPLE